jgi:hypothetical protein
MFTWQAHAPILPRTVYESTERGNFVSKWKQVVPKILKATVLAYKMRAK